MKELYLLSGLGADKRVFDFIDFSGYTTTHINWISPRDNETIESYANRLVEQIVTPNPVLIGVSFGGIMTTEISKIIATEKLILVSSAKTKFEIPFYFRLVGQMRLHKLIPTAFLKTVNSLTYWAFGTKTKDEKKLLKEIIADTDKKFLAWAVDKIVNWSNTTVPENLTHIHGTADRILPLKTADHKITDGGHLMILNKGKELGELIQKILK